MLKGCRYCLTDLGFGLNVAPIIMWAIMRATLSQDPTIKQAMLSYIHDLYINEGMASADKVKEHLESYGLTCKALEWLKDGARVLGLHVLNNKGTLDWKRGSYVLEITRRAVFSMCGKLVGHFPVCRWWCIAASFIKCHVTTVTSVWDNKSQDVSLREMITNVMDRVHQSDPVLGKWCVSGTAYAVWVNVSSMATVVVLQADESVIEDMCWLHPERDTQHINLAELDVVSVESSDTIFVHRFSLCASVAVWLTN